MLVDYVTWKKQSSSAEGATRQGISRVASVFPAKAVRKCVAAGSLADFADFGWGGSPRRFFIQIIGALEPCL